MKKIILHILFLLGMFSLAHGGDLLYKYKKKMGTTYTHAEYEVSKNENISTILTIKSLSDEIKIIKSMKKTTFESTQEFRKRRYEAIIKFEDKTDFYFKNGSQEYSAGTVQMKRYNPDTEIMTLNLSWNPEVTPLLSETYTIKTVSFTISREEAKKLFSKKEKHFFHVKIIYTNKKLTISEILLYEKYTLYKNINAKVATAVKKIPAQNISKKKTPECTMHRVVASKLNIRDEPSKKGKILGSLQKGDAFCIYETYKGWSRSKYGWLSQKYIERNRISSSEKPSQKSEKSSSKDTASSSGSSGSFAWLWIILFVWLIFFRR